MHGAIGEIHGRGAVVTFLIERGAFGIPTFFVGDEMFFGKEQLREVEEMVSGQ